MVSDRIVHVEIEYVIVNMRKHNAYYYTLCKFLTLIILIEMLDVQHSWPSTTLSIIFITGLKCKNQSKLGIYYHYGMFAICLI
jgi:hypothetical protein